MTKRLTTEPLFLRPGEIIVDNFAGGGGASTGIEQAFGRSVDIAINHDAEAVAMHAINHPGTRHYCESVFKVNPEEITEGRPVALAWFSPDCKHFSKAKGGRPVDKSIRGLAWVVVRWARRVKPRVIMLENVEEFQDWGPLTDDGYPCPIGKGKTFNLWVNQLRGAGYAVEWRELRACDYGAPTIRKRLFVIARRDGQAIVWPQPTHGHGRIPYRTAAECINWSIPCPSIFERVRPLAENTMRRIARGVMKYVVNAAEPFIVPVTHSTQSNVHSIDEPMRTVTTAKGGELALIQPFISGLAHGEHAERPGTRARGADEPLGTVSAGGGNHALVAPLLVPRYGERRGQEPRVRTAADPMPTVVPTENHGQLVAAFLAKHNGTSTDQKAVVSAILNHQYGSNTAGGCGDLDQPMTTVTAAGNHQALVHAFLLKYYGADQNPQLRDPLHTVTARDRFGLVTVHGEPYQIVDIGMRMLVPRELFNAQGFPANYVIEFMHAGRPLPKTAQVRMCGNSVPPPLARALVIANCIATLQERAA
jgi:DNA (cytosine-5)-methyltransferase 1